MDAIRITQCLVWRQPRGGRGHRCEEWHTPRCGCQPTKQSQHQGSCLLYVPWHLDQDFPLTPQADISTDDTLKQRYMSVDSPAWYEGSLSIHGLQALNASQVALRTGRYFGAVSRANLTSNKAENCIRLFYGTTETSVQEMLWCDGFVDWQSSWNFSDINGRSSPAYMGGGIFKQVAYVAFVDLQNRTRAYW